MSKEIYLCCDGKDASHEQRLRDGLKPILQRLGLALWGRRDIKGGETWDKEIYKYLKRADFFIALVSADCLASDMCNKEIQAAQYRAQHEGLAIISIRIRPCAFEYSDLASFPSLPKNGKTITEHANTDKAWTDILRDLIEMISRQHRYLQEGRV